MLLQTPALSVRFDDVFPSGFPVSCDDMVSKIQLMSDGSAERSEDYLCLGGLGDKFLWDCPETLPDRFPQTTLSVKRKLPSVEGPNRRSRGENSPAEITAQNARGLGTSTIPSGPTRRDTFRQRKPNTSRPPSMHVDDYVARERNIDSAINSNVIAVQRIGATGGRPPSIHVDEFMARQRERQNPALTVGDAAPQSKIAASVDDMVIEKSSKSKELKNDPDDDLHGIDIVFDGEDSETDDKLPFPQPDDNLQQPAPLIIEQNSPHSIVEESESDVHEGGQFSHMGTLVSNIDENKPSEFSSRMAISHPEMPLTREPSVSSDTKYFEQADDMKNVNTVKTSNGFDSTVAINSPGFPGSAYNNVSASSGQLLIDNRMTLQSFYPKNGPLPAGNVPMATGSQGHYDQRFMPNQPPLPPMPPPRTVAPVIPQTSDPVPSQSSPFVNSMTDVQQPLPTSFQVRHVSTCCSLVWCRHAISC